MADDSGRLPALMLDTNVLTFLTDPRNPKPEWDEVIRGRTLVLSFVTVGEILHATLASGRGLWRCLVVGHHGTCWSGLWRKYGRGRR